MIEATFKLNKDTKRTRRYEEVGATINGEASMSPVVGTLYVQQFALRRLNNGELPEEVTITIKVV